MVVSLSQSGFRIHEWGKEPLWEDFESNSPGTDEVLVDVEACGVGLTVLNAIRGDLGDDPALLPLVPGHEIVGRIAATGKGIDESLIGRRVVAYFYLVCDTCQECRRGREPLCVNLAGFVGVHRDGGYAPKVVLPAGNAIPIPESLDPIAATVIPDAVATPVHVAARAKIGQDDRIAVIGAGGGVGIHMIQVAKLASPHVVGLDVNEPKLAAIEGHGVRAVDSTDLTGLGALFDGGPPTVIVDLLGSEDSAAWSVEALASGGRIVVLTTFRDRPIAIEYRRLVLGEISILGSRYATKAEVGIAANLVETGKVRPVIGETVGHATLLDLHTRLRAGGLVGRGALKWTH